MMRNLTTFDANDAAMVSQYVFLNDVNEITFDLKMDIYTGLIWNPYNANVVVMMIWPVIALSIFMAWQFSPKAGY